jgi:type I restriction enzyme R subunit
MVFIFDECHRSQFGENHKAIKEFFPNAQLFGFTGTPIFAQNASYQQIEGQQASYKTTADIFQQQLHAYTITHAIEDRNVLRFHVDYYKPEQPPRPCGAPLQRRGITHKIPLPWRGGRRSLTGWFPNCASPVDSICKCTTQGIPQDFMGCPVA